MAVVHLLLQRGSAIRGGCDDVRGHTIGLGPPHSRVSCL